MKDAFSHKLKIVMTQYHDFNFDIDIFENNKYVTEKAVTTD